jgi:nucleoid-associated protein YgaU
MRKDVKFGLVLFFLIVMTGGGYFLFADRAEKAVDLAADTTKKPESAATPGTTSPTRTATGDRLADRAAPSNGATRQPRPTDAPRTGTPTDTRTADASRTRGLGDPVKLPPGPQPVVGGSDAPARSTPPVVNRPASEDPATRTARNTGEAATTPGTEAARPSTTETPARDAATTREPAVAVNTPPSGEPARPTRTPDTAPDSTTKPLPAAATPGIETHRVTGGETFASLAKTYYGRPQLADFLIHSNPQIADPARLSAGTAVKIPPLPDDRQIAEAARQAKDRAAERTAAARPSATTAAPTTGAAPAKTAEPAAAGRRTYTVKSGDTLYDIAREQLGASSRWKELLDLNKTVVKGDPKNLRPGHVLVLPERTGEKAGT